MSLALDELARLTRDLALQAADGDWEAALETQSRRIRLTLDSGLGEVEVSARALRELLELERAVILRAEQARRDLARERGQAGRQVAVSQKYLHVDALGQR